jgi:hypothetical protein
MRTAGGFFNWREVLSLSGKCSRAVLYLCISARNERAADHKRRRAGERKSLLSGSLSSLRHVLSRFKGKPVAAQGDIGRAVLSNHNLVMI